jgi:hypothetical protein
LRLVGLVCAHRIVRSAGEVNWSSKWR